MKFSDNEGSFNVVFAKNGNSPKSYVIYNNTELLYFLIDNLNDMDFLSINDNIIDIKSLVNNNIKLSRYLKLKKVL